MPRHEAAQLGAKARKRVPLDLADGYVGLAEFAELGLSEDVTRIVLRDNAARILRL